MFIEILHLISIAINQAHQKEDRKLSLLTSLELISKVSAEKFDDLINEPIPGVFGPGFLGAFISTEKAEAYPRPSQTTVYQMIEAARAPDVFVAPYCGSTDFDMDSCTQIGQALLNRAKDLQISLP